MKFQVIVGNVGTVLDTDDASEALARFTLERKASISGVGRSAGEPVTVMLDGEPNLEYVPPSGEWMITIFPAGDAASAIERTCADEQEATDFMCTYLNDEFNEAKDAQREDLLRAIGTLYTQAATGVVCFYAFGDFYTAIRA